MDNTIQKSFGNPNDEWTDRILKSSKSIYKNDELKTYILNEVDNVEEDNLIDLFRKMISCYEVFYDIRLFVLETMKGQNEECVFWITGTFIQACLLEKKETESIEPFVLEAIKQNPKLVSSIINAFVQAHLLQGKKIKDIEPFVLEAIKQNSELTFEIISTFVQICLFKGKEIKDIESFILEAIKQNSELTFEIINAFVQAHLLQGKKIKDIEPLILKAIKQNSESTFEIINTFVQGCFYRNKPTLEIIQFIRSIKDKELQKKYLGSLIAYHIFKKFRINVSGIILENDKIIESEREIYTSYKELFPEREDCSDFSEIKTKDLSEMANEYFKKKFEKSVEGGLNNEVFLNILTSLVSANPEIKTLGDFKEEHFSDFRFLNLRSDVEINSKEEFLEKAGLKESDFGKEQTNDSKTYKLIHTSYLKHGFVILIDTSKSYDEVKDPNNNDSFFIIDSSHYIKREEAMTLMTSETREFFEPIETINPAFQENGTCWLYAGITISEILKRCSTFKDILEKFGYEYDGLKITKKPTEIENINSYLTEKIISNVMLPFLKNVPKSKNLSTIYEPFEIKINIDNEYQMIEPTIFSKRLLELCNKDELTEPNKKEKYIAKLKEFREKTKEERKKLKILKFEIDGISFRMFNLNSSLIVV